MAASLRAIVLAILLSVGSVGMARAESEVLPPAAGEKIGEAFDLLPAPWVMDMASIGGRGVEARVCRGEGGECFELAMSKPSAACDGTELPAWCIDFGEGAPEEMRAAVEAVFKSQEANEIWLELVPDESDGKAVSWIADGLVWINVQVYLLALATLLVPALLGFLLGWLWRRRIGVMGSRVAGVVVLSIPAIPVAALPMEWLRIGVYDLLLMGELAAFAFLWAAHSVARSLGRRELGLVVVGLLLGGGLAELGARWLAGPPPAFPPPHVAALVLPKGGAYPHSGQNCESLFPARHPELVAGRTRFPDRPVQVLHAGDSMVEGVQVSPEARAVSLLNEGDPRVSHVNAGFTGTGLDHYYLVTRRWMVVAQVDVVVWHIFLHNDLTAMADPYSCCGNLPLLGFRDGGFEVRCREPTEAGFFGNRFVMSPVPYFLRVATHFSHFARHLCYIAGRRARKSVMEIVTLGKGLQAHRAVMRTMKEELDEAGIPFVVVMVPWRGEWETYSSVLEQQAENRSFVRSLCDELQIPCFDGREAFNEAVAREGPAPFFINEPVWDVHFSARGHKLYAEWLARVLPRDFR